MNSSMPKAADNGKPVGRFGRLVKTLVRDESVGRRRWLTTDLRFVVGFLFVLSVIPKLTAHQNEIHEFGRFGLPESSGLVYTVAGLETLGALMLLLGLATRLAAAGLTLNMVGAFLTAGLHVGGPIHLGLGSALLLASAFIAWSGPGALALDNRWNRRDAAAYRVGRPSRSKIPADR